MGNLAIPVPPRRFVGKALGQASLEQPLLRFGLHVARYLANQKTGR